MTTEDVLKQGLLEFFEGGLDEERKKRYRLAAIAYFKAITQICDLVIFRKFSKIPSSHGERFRILQDRIPKLYGTIDGIFSTYRDTYTEEIKKESVEVIKDELKNIIKLSDLEKEFKEIIEKIQ